MNSEFFNGLIERADFLTLEDETGNTTVIVMPNIYAKYRRAECESAEGKHRRSRREE
jgi:hypothetical protein